MRITFLSPPPNPSRGLRFAAIYAKHLSVRGHDVEIVCSSPRDKSFCGFVSRFLRRKSGYGYREFHDSHYHRYGVRFRISTHAGALTNADIRDGDVVIATFWKTAHWASQLNPTKGRQVYLVQHDEGRVFDLRPDVEETYEMPMLQICSTNWIADSVRSRHSSAQQVVIGYGIETCDFPRAHDLPARKNRIGFMHSVVPSKRSDLALAALEIARKQLPSLKAEVLGESLPMDLPDWIVRCERPDPKGLAELYGRCHAWLFPSDIEGFGLPILESMACGTPVIGTRAGAAPELLSGGAGILVPHGDAEAMAAAILAVCTMGDAKWQAMADLAFQTATSYTWDEATDLLEQVLLEVAMSAPSGNTSRDI